MEMRAGFTQCQVVGNPRAEEEQHQHTQTEPPKHLDLTSSSPWLQKIPLFPKFLAPVCNQGSHAQGYLLISSELPPGWYRMSQNPWHRGHPGLSPPSCVPHTEPCWILPSTSCHQGLRRAQSSSFLFPDPLASPNTPLQIRWKLFH